MYSKQSGKALFPFIITLLLGLCVYLYLPNSQGEQLGYTPTATQVTAHTVASEENAVLIEAIGSARANQAIYIKSAQSDYVTDIFFNDGDLVSKGQKLVQLQSQQEQLTVEELAINLREEKRQLERLTELSRSQATAKSLLEEQLSRVDATQAQLENAKTKLAEMTIKAPFSGILGKRQISIGAYVSNSTIITSLDDISIIKVDFKVPEKYLAQLNVGMKVMTQNDAYPEKTFTGKVTHVSARIDAVTRSVEVTASFSNKSGLLRPGMLLNTALQLSSNQAMMVPEKAVIPQQDKHYVFQIEDGVATKVEVHVAGRHNGWVAIDQGISNGQQVVTEGIIKIRSGSKVTVKG
ncbi:MULTISPECIES: efflux RND transporter periplasmic adaptor subunit [unclassified Pseudoalteromonas]|nr:MULTISPECIES: efflux RND transporter periplasmic adaptor subunit [unclassified Pseudoalteromonas]MDN3378848.1 efflux RND transporter periplasmic adaptor subunit [Pseudoalteromonas sp. APC 3893]MDN3387494.1 efflux RND transporter periplasmic adaptor subunit [Pseudoalteromonas sp. APC 4017]OUS74171.1 efflux transporter periplasmic adaptor subunit [Pseudoalteromonas sp. A601]